MRVVGIDPGVHGAVGYLSDSETIVTDLPVYMIGTTSQVDAHALDQLLRAWEPHLVVVEDNRANGRNGSLANYSMGFSMGTIIAVVTMLRFRLRRVRPVDWQREMGLATVPGPARKGASRRRAQELWPNLMPDLQRVADHNRAEALLIAEYEKRQP